MLSILKITQFKRIIMILKDSNTFWLSGKHLRRFSRSTFQNDEVQEAWKPVITSVWSPDWVALWLRTVVWTLSARNATVGFEIFHYWLFRLSVVICPCCTLHSESIKDQWICPLFTEILKSTKYPNIEQWRVSLVVYSMPSPVCWISSRLGWVSPCLTSCCHDK